MRQKNEPASVIEVSLEESDRTFREALAYALFVTDPDVVAMAAQNREAGNDLEATLEILWRNAIDYAGQVAYSPQQEAMRRAGVVHEEMVKRLEKMP